MAILPPRSNRALISSVARWALVGSVAALLLFSQHGYPSSPPGGAGREPAAGAPRSGLKLGLVDNRPRPGFGPMRLDRAVSRLLHDYGLFTLARFTARQEQALRSAGYRVRVLPEPDRVGIGYYAFRVPPGPVDLPPDLTSDQSGLARGTYLVKLIGPARDAWLDSIRALGGEILTPVPAFTYLVRLATDRRGRLESLPFVRWTGDYHPAYKLNSDLAGRERRGELGPEPEVLNVLVFRSGDPGAVANRLRAMGGTILGRHGADFYETIVARIASSRAPELARLPDVYVVEPVRERRLEDESSTQILAGQVDGNGIPFRPALGEPTYADWLAERDLDGSNVTIGYVDDGVLNDDPTGHLSGRVNDAVCGDPGAAGHGHFGASTAGGVCPHVPEAGTGFLFGLGVAPGVSFISLPLLNPQLGCNVDEATLARLTVTSTGPNAARGTVQNNSWGAGAGDFATDVTYTSFERLYDLLVRDADSRAGGNQQLITCFSAGNSGDSVPGTRGDSPASLTRPKAAKNIMTTGSSSVYRTLVGATNIDDRSPFSSQGPTFDGRIKPEFMAPGGAGVSNTVGIASASIGGFGAALGDGLHSLSAGTSFSTPQTAGASALLVQWWRRFAPATPSPAMVKALLIHSARDMQGGNTPEPIPNRREGWGRWNLGNIIEPGPPSIVAEGTALRKTSGLSTLYLDQSVVLGVNGDEHRIRITPQDPAVPIRATLVWTDAPGAVDSCPSLVNDLDLELVRNGSAVLRGNAFASGATVEAGPADTLNNVEQVIEPDPSGFYTLTVRAVTLAGDGIPGNADSTDQDFALVISNAVPYAGPILASTAVATADLCGGSGSGDDTVIDPGETLSFTVTLANSGASVATAVSATLAAAPQGVAVLDGSSAYPDIAAGGASAPLDPLGVVVAEDVPCGAGLDLSLTVSTDQGSFAVPVHLEVGSRSVTAETLSGSTGTVSDDITAPSEFITPPAGPGTIRSVSVDLDIASTGEFLFNDYSVELISPQGTAVLLHSDPLPCFELNASYPDGRLPQSGSLDSFRGEDAAGIWTLRVTDRNNTEFVGGGPPRPTSEATVISWTLRLETASASACNTCVAAAPPEVSAPGSPTPLTVDREPASGAITLRWEDQGTLSDSYRVYQGALTSLPGSGVTPSDAAPIRCGITVPEITLAPDPGGLYFLVAGEKGTLIGPLGESSDPAAFPRSASQICP